jgi:branched-chain amino acid aminotransferase
MSESPNCWINGALVTRSEAKISVYDHGFLYGDGVFEGHKQRFLLRFL